MITADIALFFLIKQFWRDGPSDMVYVFIKL